MKTSSESLGIATVKSNFLHVDWPAPGNVKTLLTTRNDGVNNGVYRSLNVGIHVGDNPEYVTHNREIVQQQISVPVAYLNQTHSNKVVLATDALERLTDVDAFVDNTGRAACAGMAADCLPALFCDKAGTVVAAAHTGWKGLAGGILQNTIRAMNAAPIEIMAYLGPAVGPDAFEVGRDVVGVFYQPMPESESTFESIGDGKFLVNIYALARMILQREGVSMIYGGDYCMVLERNAFFSYRREGQTGRMVSVVWLEKQ